MLLSERIEAKDLEKYGECIPGVYHERIRSEELFAVASFDAAVAGFPLVGVTVLGTVDLWAQILWYVLTPAYDTPAYLAELIRARVSDAQFGGEAEGVYVTLSGSDRQEADARVFAHSGFTLTESDSSVLSFELGSINTAKLPEIKEESGFIALEKADEKILRILANHMANDARNVPVEIPVPWDRYDHALSIVRMEEGNPAGTVLVRMHEGTAYIELAYDTEPRDFLRMLSVLIRRGQEKLDPKTRVVVAILDERLFDVMKVIAPDANREKLIRAHLRIRRESAVS